VVLLRRIGAVCAVLLGYLVVTMGEGFRSEPHLGLPAALAAYGVAFMIFALAAAVWCGLHVRHGTALLIGLIGAVILIQGVTRLDAFPTAQILGLVIGGPYVTLSFFLWRAHTAAALAAANKRGQPTDFYVTGGTLHPDAPSYVVRRADMDLYEGLARGEYCYVLTTRQMGKSSMMVRTARRLRAEGAAVAVLDLTQIGSNLDAEQWYDGLLVKLGEQLDREDELDDFWQDHRRLGPLQRFMAALEHLLGSDFGSGNTPTHTHTPPPIQARLVIFIDEIDFTRSLPFSTDEFFAAIRECHNRRSDNPLFSRLTFCLLGVATPSDLIRDTRTTPFNIGKRIELSDFTEGEALPLAQGFGAQKSHAAALLKRALYWTGGHPYLTQRLCRAVAESGTAATKADVDRLCEELFLSSRARERDDNLLFVRERLLRSEADRASLLDLYQQVWDRKRSRVPDDETSHLVGILRLAGLVRTADGFLCVRNRIYYRVFDRAWVTANLPDTERVRQERAYRRGLLRAAGIAGLVVSVMAALSVGAIGQARRANQASRQANDRATQLSLRAAATTAIRDRQETLWKEIQPLWPPSIPLFYGPGLQTALFQFPASRMFTRESPTLTLEGVSILSRWAEISGPLLTRLEGREAGALVEIRVSGHCGVDAKDPWTLSTRRAQQAARVLLATPGFPGYLVSASGSGWSRRAYEPTSEVLRKRQTGKRAVQDRVDIVLLFAGDPTDNSFISAWDGQSLHGPENDISISTLREAPISPE